MQNRNAGVQIQALQTYAEYTDGSGSPSGGWPARLAQVDLSCANRPGEPGSEAGANDVDEVMLVFHQNRMASSTIPASISHSILLLLLRYKMVGSYTKATRMRSSLTFRSYRCSRNSDSPLLRAEGLRSNSELSVVTVKYHKLRFQEDVSIDRESDALVALDTAITGGSAVVGW